MKNEIWVTSQENVINTFSKKKKNREIKKKTDEELTRKKSKTVKR